MATTPTPSRAVAALVTGAATALYYASPDFITSRSARGWTKAGLMAVSLAAAIPDFRAARAATRRQQAVEGEESPSRDVGSPPLMGKVAVFGSVTAILAGVTGFAVLVERWIFRRGNARAVAGVRLPHTRAALLYGALSAGLCILTAPSGTADADSPPGSSR